MKENFQLESNINPEYSSTREEMLELISDNGVYIDKESHEIFHKINKFPETQRFVSLLLKGVINVSDIVKYKDEYFSHEQNIQKLDSSESFSEDEINADNFILTTIINDNDHYKSKNTFALNHHNDQDEWNKIEYVNMAIDKNSNKRYYYDFEAAEFEYPAVETPAQLKEYIDLVSEYLKNFSAETLVIVHRKVGLLIENLFNENGFESFKAIVDRSNILKAWDSNKAKYDLSGKKDALVARELFEDLRSRLEAVHKMTGSQN